jgi:capsule polysaccharide export protein KpsE/RkpR
MGLATQLLGLNNSGQTFVGVLTSRTVEDDILARFGLMRLWKIRYPEDARKRLENITDIAIDDKTGVMTVAVSDTDPKLAAAIVQAYIEEMNQVLATVNISSAHRERVFIEQRRAEIKKELDDSAKEFSEFASQNAAIDIPEQSKAMVAAAADLQAQLITAESMLKGLQQIYTDNNARVREMKAQVVELERQLNKVGGKDVTPANGSELSKDDLYPSVRQLPLLGVRYLELYRRQDQRSGL